MTDQRLIPEQLGWPDLPAAQQPSWPDLAARDSAVARLRGMPPLVFAGECDLLRGQLAEAARGRAFVLQGGDCAETFDGVGADAIRAKLKTVLQMAIVLTYGASMPVVKVGRIAGQFAKPRSATTERIGDIDLPSFYGHLVNDDAPTAEAREHDPLRMVRAYDQSARTLNLLRAFSKGGFADITRVHEWNQEFVATSAEGRRYEQVASEIERALRFMTACGIDLAREAQLHQVDVWTSHEGLVLDYEEGLTRRDSLTGDWYDCSAHMLWIGERTRQPQGAHAAFFAGVHNPLGVKLGPSASPQELVELCALLDPHRTPGRLTLIARMGAARVREALPPLLQAVRDAGHPVVWSCDPMHANGIRTASGLKTRRFDAIMDELEGFVATCRSEDTWPGGVHLEFTGEDVTECLGGAEAVLEDQLETRYMTLCDPRLNARQSLDLAFRLAELLRGDARHR